MKILTASQYVIKNLRRAAALSPLMILAVMAAEGLQHVVEYGLGMYESQAAFHTLQNHRARLGFGLFKAIIMLSACYVIAKNIASDTETPPKFGTFRADMLRKLWDPTFGFTGLLISLILAAPIIFLHYQLSYLAMGHSAAPLILLLDSFVIGVLALVIGTSIWAGDKAEQDLQIAPGS